MTSQDKASLDRAGIMARRGEILARSMGLDYQDYRRGRLEWDYEGLMSVAALSFQEGLAVQHRWGVGGTPLLELHRVTALARKLASPGKGARIFIKDEAANPSGSFKDRRACLAVREAARRGFRGVVAATSGNYGAAVASQAARQGLKAVIVQETFDSAGRGQPEILEKGRRCESYGAEVLQATVGPELFTLHLAVLEETGFYNASLYSPLAVAGIETLGWELAGQVRHETGRDPDVVAVTHAGGGNVTGTARGLRRAGCRARVVAVSVDLRGLHMADDHDFNRKFFTTGHTGFGIPFATWPDRADVPFNAARPLRYMDEYVLVTEGEVFYVTEMLARLEGLERGPAGNISLAAAFALARDMDQEAIIVVQETEYTGAGKLPAAQLTFAREMGVAVRRGDPRESRPGESIVIPSHPAEIWAEPLALDGVRRSYLRRALAEAGLPESPQPGVLTMEETEYLAREVGRGTDFVRDYLSRPAGLPVSPEARGSAEAPGHH